MHRDHVLKDVRSGKSVEVASLILVNGGIPQRDGLAIDAFIRQWLKDNAIGIHYEDRDHFGKMITFVMFSPK